MISTRFLQFLVSVFFALLVIDADGRGFRGGGGRGGGGFHGGGRSHVSRAPSRPTPSHRPSSRPSSRLSSRPSTGFSSSRLSPSRLQSFNRSPSLSDRSRLTGNGLSPGRQAARDRSMVNPQLRPLFEGSASQRKQAANRRLQDAARKPGKPVPGGRAINDAKLKNRTARAAAVRKGVDPMRGNVFNQRWIDDRIGRFPQGWNYWHGTRPPNYWWRGAAWAGLSRWLAWTDEPYYYWYGDSVYYDDDVIYADDEPVASYDDWVETADDLADHEDPPADAKIDWESLGTWAISTDKDQESSNMLVQLVIAPDGRVGGTYYNKVSDNTQRIHGALDKDTQRIAFKIGNSKTTVLEVGLANLTKDTAPLWVHFTAKGHSQVWLMVRLESPESTPEKDQ